ncbi:I78 family peptidase inhibitor [Croceicoccus sediminis]|uniref:I78 family peptidase inhibitor n=1 Tax=Croceicoccus sediminis TaxID=2571150 RepID=UPI00147942CD|nr:I78 family peptidase inhibitor [Croceicoccus sediminis]
MIRLALLAAPVLLAGCATTTTEMSEPVRIGADGACDASDAQAMLGMTASAEVGAQLLEATGARTLRWAPPRSAMTMDFRPDRLTVSYDDDMKIDRISCG